MNGGRGEAGQDNKQPLDDMRMYDEGWAFEIKLDRTLESTFCKDLLVQFGG